MPDVSAPRMTYAMIAQLRDHAVARAAHLIVSIPLYPWTLTQAYLGYDTS